MNVTSGQWQTTVTELMAILRDALTSLIPVIERAQIAWRDEDAYDDWDNMCDSLYQNIVIRSLDFSVGQGERLVLPKYGMVYDSYSDKSYFRIVSTRVLSAKENVFVGFGSDREPCDRIRYATLSKNLDRATDVASLPLEDTKFEFMHLRSNSERNTVTLIVVDL